MMNDGIALESPLSSMILYMSFLNSKKYYFSAHMCSEGYSTWSVCVSVHGYFGTSGYDVPYE